MYRRFLNDDDYLSVISKESLAQMTRGNTERFIQAEESAEMSIVEYLSENYEIEKEFNKGKYIADYDRSISYPVEVHIFYEDKIYATIRAISGYKAPADIDYWEEHLLIENDSKEIQQYSQFETYYKDDLVCYNGLFYKCMSENGHKFGNIRIPLVNGCKEKTYDKAFGLRKDKIYFTQQHERRSEKKL